MEGVIDRLAGQNSDGGRLQVVIQRLAEAKRVPGFGGVEMGHLAGCVNPGIGATGPGDPGGLTGEA